MKIRVLIVDDELLARDHLRALLEQEVDLEVTGEAADGKEATDALRRLAPDVVFLDVQMPERNGFEVLAEIPPADWPVVVFVTAYDQYTLQAFEAHAADYLLKPFDHDRLRAAVAHARDQVTLRRSRGVDARLLELVAGVGSQPGSERLVLRGPGRLLFFELRDVDWFEGAGNYVKLHIGREVHMHRARMSDLEDRLDSKRFVRIHRSIIVNTDRIKEIQPLVGGSNVMILKDGTRLQVSRGYRGRLDELGALEI